MRDKKSKGCRFIRVAAFILLTALCLECAPSAMALWQPAAATLSDESGHTDAQALSTAVNFTVAVAAAEFDADGFVNLPVTMTNCPGIAGFRFHVVYDRTAIELVSITSSQDAVAKTLCTNLDDANRADTFLTWYTCDDVVLDGEILLLRFKRNDQSLKNYSEVRIDVAASDVCNDALEDVPLLTIPVLAFSRASTAMYNGAIGKGESGITVSFDLQCTYSDDVVVAGVAFYDDRQRMTAYAVFETPMKSGTVLLPVGNVVRYAYCKVFLLRDYSPLCESLMIQ